MEWYGHELDERGIILRPGDDPVPGKVVIEAFPTSGSLTIWVGAYGPRGGRSTIASGDLDSLREERRLLSEAIAFGEEVERAWKRWRADHSNEG